ncbi:MAG TPA: class I SAM-dependent methyltransferase, partial [Thermoleophilaceae bacterium]|nr:class I SAM-dependent methyltransferase [Thermoleophilaceae bacterium]
VDTEQSGDRWPAIVRRDNVVGCCFSLFAFLGQGATIAPFDGAQHLNWHRPLALEATLIALIDDMHRRAGAVRARVLPWPMGVDWVLNVRHDYDRELTRPRLEAVLDAHARAGTAATWYWRARHVNQTSGPQGGVGRSGPRLVSRRAGHEVALHTDKLWAGAEREQAAVESAAGRKVDGTSAHGDPSCFRWQGAPNVMWAEHRELSYTEFISHAHMHLHRFAALGGDGTLHASAVLCLPHHESFDRSMNPGDTAAEAIAKVAANYARTGGFMQILNHPDINVDELFDTIARLPTAGRLDWTAREAADWWRRTHVADELQVTAIDEHRVRLSSRRGARGLVVELAAPDGTTKRFVLHLEPGDPVELAMPGAPAPAPSRSSSWSASGAPRFAQAVRDYYTARGQPVSADALKTTVDTNSKLVPGRVSTLLKLLGELTDRERLKDARVLEAGCGFGALATYIAQSEEPALVTGIDVREDLVATAREVAARLDLRNLEFRLADMRDLGGIPDSRFDVVIVNNAFVYLRTRRAMREAAAEFARVLAPGGHILMFHANRWQPRDPFTGDPVVHLLGERSARLVGRLTGWHGSHDRLTLLSPRALARILRRAGFELPRAGVVRHGTVKTGRPLLGRYYGIAARRS